MFKKKYLMIIVALCFFAAGCKNSVQTAGTENDIKFDSLEISAEYHLLGDTGNPNCSLQAKFIYPADCKDREMLEKIKSLFVSDFFGENSKNLSPDSAIQRYRNEYLSAYRKLEKEYRQNAAGDSTAGYWYNYYESTRNEIVYNKSGIISYSVITDCYTGGAHGGKRYKCYVIDLKSGNKLTEQDIFIDGFKDELSKAIVNALVKKYGLRNVSQLEESAEIFSVDEILPNNNFLIDSLGITYIYNEYEIAPYSAGIIDVVLPFDKIKHLLKKDSEQLIIKN